MIKRIICLILVLVMVVPFATSCTYVPPEAPIIPGDDDDDDFVPDGDEVDFDSALEAYLYGESYFNEEAKFYETTQFGTAMAMGIGTYVMTKRYKSDVTNNFLYETNTLGTPIMGIDPTFALKSYTEDGDTNIYYARVDGSEVNSGAIADPAYTTPSFRGSTASYENVAISTKQTWADYKRDVGGNLPKELTVYIVNEDTVDEVLSFEKDVNGFAFHFKLSLNSGAVEDYRDQVRMYSKQAYNGFNPLGLDHGLTIEVGMDRFGRIQRLDIVENYSVHTGAFGVSVANSSVEYISYNKRPEISIKEDNVFNGPAITYAALPTDDTIESYTITFNASGGSTPNPIPAYYNGEIGALPESTYAGHIFDGWYTAPNGMGERFTPTTLYLAREDITLYAYWNIIDDSTQDVYAPINGGEEYVLVKGVSTTATYAVPTTYKQKPVTAVGENAFRNNATITNLTVHKDVRHIGAGAFYSVKTLETLVFEEGSALESIGENAFYSCSKLNGVKIPSSVHTIGESAFYSCTGLREVSFGAGSKLTRIEKNTFMSCNNSNFKSIVIPEGVEEIGVAAFKGCNNLTSVTFLGAMVTVIGNEAFHGCRQVTSLEIPHSVVEIGDSAFFNWSGLTSVLFDGASLRRIGKSAFDGANKLTTLRIPASVTEIDNEAFRGCSGITSLTFAVGSELAVIGNSAFANVKPVSIVIPASVRRIGNNAFSSGGTVSTGGTASGGNAVTEQVSFAYGSKLEIIGDNAFHMFTNPSYTSIVIPASVREIGSAAFRWSLALASVEFEKDSVLEKIGSAAFMGCSADGFTSIALPSSVVEIGGAAFANTKITSIDLTSNNNFKLVGGVLYSADYKTLVMGLSTLVTGSTTIDSRVETILPYAFYGCDKLAISSLPSNVKSIGEYAFFGCVGLTSFAMPNSVEEMGMHAFNGCANLTSFTLSNKITEIPNYAFAGCGFSTITLHSGITRIGQNAFRNSGLTTVSLPNTVTVVDSNAFFGSASLKTIELSDSLATLGSAAFSGCVSLERIDLPATLAAISNSTFQNCGQLKEVIVRRTAEQGITTLAASNIFSTAHADLKIYVPANSLDAYKAATNWSNASVLPKILPLV